MQLDKSVKVTVDLNEIAQIIQSSNHCYAFNCLLTCISHLYSCCSFDILFLFFTLFSFLRNRLNTRFALILKRIFLTDSSLVNSAAFF